MSEPLMNRRLRLPNRRELETLSLVFEGHAYAVSVGFDTTGQVREVFVTGQRQGSTLDATLDDAAIVISHHLQRGGTAEDLRRSLSRLGAGLGAAREPASPLGAVATGRSAGAVEGDYRIPSHTTKHPPCCPFRSHPSFSADAIACSPAVAAIERGCVALMGE